MNENVNVQIEKKGVKPGIVFLLVIIFSALFGVGGWFLGTKLANVEDKNQTKEPAPVEDNNENVVPEKNTKYTFAKEVVEELAFGPETKKLYSYYYIDKETVKDYDDVSKEVYVMRREVYLADKLIAKLHMLSFYESNDEALSAIPELKIKLYHTFKDVKKDSYYNIVEVEKFENIIDGELSYGTLGDAVSYLIDVDGNVLKEYQTKYAGTSILGLYADKEMIKGKYSVTIEKEEGYDYPEGKDYYLYPKDRTIDGHEGYFYYFGYAKDDLCSFEEKKITVENGKVVEIILATYSDFTDVELAGQSC